MCVYVLSIGHFSLHLYKHVYAWMLSLEGCFILPCVHTYVPSTTSMTASPTSEGIASLAATRTAIAPPILQGRKAKKEEGEEEERGKGKEKEGGKEGGREGKREGGKEGGREEKRMDGWMDGWMDRIESVT